MRRLLVSTLILFALFLLFSPIHAVRQPTSYCKCVCFQNSTIIPLNSPPSTSTTPSHSVVLRDDADGDRDQKHRTLTCTDCNRAFCLDYNLPICKNAKEEDVFATCFQRDSLKDRTIVTIFLLATAALLGWALAKPFVVKTGVQDVLGRYTPVGHRAGLSAGRDGDGGLPRRNHDSAQGFGGGDQRPARPGTSGSISRQGGLNS